MFSKRNAIIGWLVVKVAKRRMKRAAPASTGSKAAAAGAAAGLGALLGGLMFWRRRRSGSHSTAS